MTDPGHVTFNGEPWPLRKPCARCGGDTGTIRTTNGQDIVRCDCGHYSHAAPKDETGRGVRNLSSRPGLKPSQTMRLRQRDGNTCVLCHRQDVELHVGHLISVDYGRKRGMTDDELFDDENLAVMCAECNNGLRDEPIHLKVAFQIFTMRMRWREDRA